MTYCENCKFFIEAKAGKRYGRCGAPNAVPLGGEHFINPDYERPYATSMRLEQCGARAKWFEPKPDAQVAA